MYVFCFAFGQFDGAQADIVSASCVLGLQACTSTSSEGRLCMEKDLMQAKYHPTSAVSSYGALAEKSRQGNQPRLT